MFHTENLIGKNRRVSSEGYSGSTTEVEESELINIVRGGQKIKSSIIHMEVQNKFAASYFKQQPNTF